MVVQKALERQRGYHEAVERWWGYKGISKDQEIYSHHPELSAGGAVPGGIGAILLVHERYQSPVVGASTAMRAS